MSAPELNGEKTKCQRSRLWLRHTIAPPEARPLLLRRPEAFILAWESYGQVFLRGDVGASVVSGWDIVKKVPYT